MPAGCSVSGCLSEIRARGLCASHWNRMHRYGDPNFSPQPRGRPLMRKCDISECPNRHEAHGLCPKHLRRSRLGQPLTTEDRRLIRGPSKTCTYNGCGRGRHGRGLCRRHYAQAFVPPGRYAATQRRCRSAERAANSRAWRLRNPEYVKDYAKKRAHDLATALPSGRNRSRWQPAEDAIVTRNDLSLIEMSYMLDRSIRAVDSRRNTIRKEQAA